MRSDRSHRFVMLALLAALMGTGLLAVAPTGSAQIIWIGGADRSYGWSFPNGDFPGATADDPSADLALDLDGTAVGVDAAAAYQILDLVRLRIDEPDAEVLRLQIDVASMDPHRFHAENFLNGVHVRTTFEVGGNAFEVAGYLSTACRETIPGVCESYTDPGLAYNPALYQYTEDGREILGRLPSRVLVDDGRIEVLVPRWALDRTGPGTAPFAGDGITAVRVETSGGGICFVVCTSIGDRLPDEGAIEGLHTLHLDSNGARVGFADGRIAAGGMNEYQIAPLVPRIIPIDVDPEGTVRFPLTIENREDHKVLLQPAVRGAAGDVAASVPGTLEIPARSERTLMITLNESVRIEVDTPLLLQIDFKVLGATLPIQDEIAVTVRAVPPLSLEQNKLYFHTKGQDYTGLSEYGIDTLRSSEGVLNTLADDPLDHGDGATMHSMCICLNSVWGWNGEARLSAALTLSNETPLVYHLTVDAPVAGELDLRPSLFLGDLLVSHVDRTIAVEQGENVLSVQALVQDDALDLVAGDGPFYLDLETMFRPADLVLGELVGIAEPVDPRLKVQGASWIEFPIVEAPQRGPQAAHLTVTRAPDSDKVQYVNSGRAVLWNVTITNQANEVDTVTVAADVPAGWKARVAPDDGFKLGPGESVTAGVFVTAPKDAKEGDSAKFSAIVASKLGDGATVALPLVAVVTHGATFGEPHYEPDNATRERSVSRIEAKESPGLGIVASIGLAAVLLRHTRRSSTQD